MGPYVQNAFEGIFCIKIRNIRRSTNAPNVQSYMGQRPPNCYKYNVFEMKKKKLSHIINFFFLGNEQTIFRNKGKGSCLTFTKA